MADPNTPPEMWSWLDTIWGFGSGAVAGVLGMLAWVNPKFKRVHKLIEDSERKIDQHAQKAHEENDHLAGELHARITNVEKLIAVLQENNREAMRVYAGIKDELKSLANTTNEQTKILYQMRGALKIKGDDHE